MLKAVILTDKQLRRRAKKAWDHMFDRCYNPRNSRFHAYGGRGIKVSKRWYKFEQFYADVGDPPIWSDSIDRVDNNGNYEPGNVRWANTQEQADNGRAHALSVIMDGTVRITQTEAAERLGSSPKHMAKRLAALRKKGVTTVQFADLEARTAAARALWAGK